MDDYYAILGVSRSASQEEIKKAYRKLAMKHHPDRGGDGELLSKINEAYDVLGDPNKRQQYDNPQPEFNFHTGGFGSGNPFEDVFAHAFGFGGRRPRHHTNRDIQINYSINLEDCYTGRVVTLSYRLPSGQNETIDVKIPAGIKNGDVVHVDGYGDNSHPELPRGRLIVRIHVKSSPNWNVDGINLHTIKTVSIFDLVIGGEIEFDTPEKKTVKLTVPPGTQPGTVFSINGYGLPNRKTGQKGKIFIKINGEVPVTSDKNIINKIQQIKNELD